MPVEFERFVARAILAFVGAFLAGPALAETRVVRRGENLQAALDAARPGDVLMLEAGAEFSGNFVLRVKSGSTPIVIRSAAHAALPKDGVRIGPAHAPVLARIRSSNAMAALRTEPGTANWELRYLEFAGNQGGHGDIIQLGDGSRAQSSLEQVPRHFVLAHLYVHGDPAVGQKRCIALNAADVTIRDSHISDCKGVGMDTQAIAGWNGPGPYVIENNYLEGAGENVMFGGADPSIPDLVPSNIRFRGNHVARPLAWRDPILASPTPAAAAGADGSLPPGRYAYRVVARGPVGQGTIGRSTASEETAVVMDGQGAVRLTWPAVAGATEYRVYGRIPGKQDTYWTVKTTSFVDGGSAGAEGQPPTAPGTVWTVKNLFELKNARDVLVEHNVFENHWRQAQAGYAIVFTPRNSNGGCRWCGVERVQFKENVVRHVSAGVNLLGYDAASRPTRQTQGIVIRGNLFHDMGAAYDGNGWFLLIGDGPRDVVVDHNTIVHTGTTLVYAYGGTRESVRRVEGFRFTNNAAAHGKYGLGGAFFTAGREVIDQFFPGSTVTANFLAGKSTAPLPAGNLTGGDLALEFVDAARGNFRLRPASRLRGRATDGGDIGADVSRLMTIAADVEAGRAPGVTAGSSAGTSLARP